MANDFVIVSSWGTQDLTQKIEDINDPNFSLKEYLFSDMKVIFSGKNRAVVTYKANYKFVAGGNEGGGSVNCSSVWENHENKWQGILHTEALPANN